MSIGSALRGSLRDFYFNSWRLAPANLLWGIVLLLALVAGPLTLPGIALLVLLAVPTAGLYRMGALIAREEPADFSDFVAGMRTYGPAGVLVGAGAAVLAFVFTTNVVVGVQADNPVGWVISALALWGDVGLLMFLTVFWPVLADPRREGLGLRRRLALTGVAVIGRPLRIAALLIVVTFILAVSTVLVAALLLVSVAYVAIVSSRVVLPLVDEVEARLPEEPGPLIRRR
jgi:uncharacterized membrane protein YesL